jgi:hypothetical protein
MNQYTSSYHLGLEKVCSKCKQLLPKTSFRMRTQNGYTFYRGECRACDRKRSHLAPSNRKLSIQSQARLAARNAVKSGRLIKPKNCSKCGKEDNLHGHHANGYENKLDVTWLCPDCHRKEHTKLPVPSAGRCRRSCDDRQASKSILVTRSHSK